jgi:5-methylthioadenosine/S-adenosylhomocysteine deaminase
VGGAGQKSGEKELETALIPFLSFFAPRFEWVNQIVFNASPANVEWVFIDGQPLKRKGELVGVDPETVVRAAQKAATRIRRDLLN